MEQTQNKRMKTQRRNKAWLRSPDQRKHKKMFNVQMVQLRDGSFHLVGGGAKVSVKANGSTYNEYLVDVRDLATEMRLNGVKSF